MNVLLIPCLTLLALLVLAVAVIMEVRARVRDLEKASELPVQDEWFNFPERRLP